MELDLLATILGQSILTFSSDAAASNASCRVLDSDIGRLKFSFRYDQYASLSTNNPIHPLNIPIVHIVNHLRALVPPQNYVLSKIRNFFPR